jgi:hypothetical protein
MFGSLINPSFPKYSIGIEKESISAIALQKEGRNQFGIRQAATVSLPSNLLLPSFTDRNISDLNLMAALLSDAAVNANLRRQKRWSVSLPSNTARTAILTLETKPANSKELEEVLSWKAERSFGSPMSEMRVSHQAISPDSDGKGRYFSTAIRYDILDEYENIFNALGWHCGLILPRQISEAKWLMNAEKKADSLLISSQNDGFTAILFRKAEPNIVRSVICNESERDDEIYRLLMFYNDKLVGETTAENALEKLLVIGKDFNLNRLREIARESLGKTLQILSPSEVGLNLPAENLHFDEIAAPAGLATLAWN